MTAHPVVVGHDGHALGPLRTAELLARALHEPLTVGTAYAYEPVSWSARGLPPDVNDRREHHAEQVAEGALAVLHTDGEDEARVRILPATGSAEALLDLTSQEDALLLVVGPDRRGAVTRELVSKARCPVVVSPADAMVVPPRLSVVGVAYDGSSGGRFALTAAVRLAELSGASLRIFTVADRLPTSHAADLVAQGAARVDCDVDLTTSVLHGRAGEQLRRACEDLDLLACGTHGRGRLQAAFLGSVSSHLVTEPVCPVLVVPPRARVRDLRPLRLSTGAGDR